MRQVRIKSKNVVVGSRVHQPGEVAEVPDDHRAAALVKLGHADYVAGVSIAVSPAPRASAQRAIEPKAGEQR